MTDIVEITGESPLVLVTYMETAEEAEVHNKKRIYIVLGLVLLGFLAMALFHFFVKPLDVTWYILLRKLGV